MAIINTWPGWQCIRELGEGSYGHVYEIQRTEYGRTYREALKVITIPRKESDLQKALNSRMDARSVRAYFQSSVDRIMSECALMSDLKGYTNIVSYTDHRLIPHEGKIGWDIMIRMELLTSLMEYTKKHTMSESDVRRMGMDICEALKICQEKNILHRDIKPENIFLNDRGNYKLGDFGVARHMENDVTAGTQTGTVAYMAPEIYLGKPYGHAADIYSLGMVLYLFLNNCRLPFVPQGSYKPEDERRARERRMNGEPVPFPMKGSSELKAVVLKALEFDPRKRYVSAAEFKAALERCRVSSGTKQAVTGRANGSRPPFEMLPGQNIRGGVPRVPSHPTPVLGTPGRAAIGPCGKDGKPLFGPAGDL